MNKILSLVSLVMMMCTTFRVFAACQHDDDQLPDVSCSFGSHTGGQ
ncbi:hypothetical protein [Ewingella americana]|nr:hypothetical protein [Ewingella americana]